MADSRTTTDSDVAPVNVFRAMALTQGLDSRELETLAQDLGRFGLVSLDIAKASGPFLIISQGERMVPKEPHGDQWAAILLYTGTRA